MNSSYRYSRVIVDIIETLVIALAISVIIYLTIAIPNQVEGQSMEPNFHHNDFLLTNKTIQWLGKTSFGQSRDYDYQRGDVIIFHKQDSDLIKRVIAKDGDTVMIKENEVFVNGRELEEKYIPITTRTRTPQTNAAFIQEGETLTVPENNYFVLGDNRENSKDSRYSEVGFISRDLVKGRVFFRYWPLNKFGIIRTGEYIEQE